MYNLIQDSLPTDCFHCSWDLIHTHMYGMSSVMTPAEKWDKDMGVLDPMVNVQKP